MLWASGILFPHALQAQLATPSSSSPSCTKIWDLDIALRDKRSSNRDTLTIGQSSSATDNIDSACGEKETPPVPPVNIFGVNFQLPGGTTYSKVDIRNSGDEATWTMMLGGQHPFVLQWDTTGMPAGVFRLYDAVDGSIININLKGTTRLTVRQKAVKSLKIQKYPESNCTNLSVKKGWNLISIPFDAEDNRVTALFGSRKVRAFAYSSGYVRVKQLNAGQGYWVSFPKTRTYQICGQQAGSTISVSKGWNLIATHNADKAVTDISTSPSNIVQSSYFGFTTAYVQSDSLKIGQGYWVETDDAGTITVADASKHSGLPSESPLEPAAVDSSWSTLTLESISGVTQQLYLSHNPISSADMVEYEMPPRAPGNGFDARFATNLQVGAIYGGPSTIMLEATTTPVRVSVEDLPYSSLKLESLESNKPLTLYVDETRAVMVPAGYGVFTVEQVPRRVSVEEELTAEKGLEPLSTYPNPFSSSTNIQFRNHLAQAVRVTLFNVLGQELKVLYDQHTAPGIHQVRVDGSDLPPGLYMYRIETSTSATTHTMSIVR